MATKAKVTYWVHTTHNSISVGSFGPFRDRREAERMMSGLGAAVAQGKITGAHIEESAAS